MLSIEKSPAAGCAGVSPVQRIRLGTLEPRGADSSDAELQRVLKSLGAGEGEPCRANCDCRIGLVCRDSSCESDW